MGFRQFYCLQKFLGQKNPAIAYYIKGLGFGIGFYSRRVIKEGYSIIYTQNHSSSYGSKKSN